MGGVRPKALACLLAVLAVLGAVKGRVDDLPPVGPSPSKIVFLTAATGASIPFQMLNFAKELVARGHHVTLAGSGRQRSRVEAAGVHFHNLGIEFLGGRTERQYQLTDLWTSVNLLGPNRRTWQGLDAVSVFVQALADTYEKEQRAFQAYLDEHGRPDLIIPDAFLMSVIDTAHHLSIPYIIFYPFPVGGLYGFGDVPSVPETAFGEHWPAHTTFSARLRKALMTPYIILKTLSAGAQVNTARRKLGFAEYNDPTTNWQGHMVLVTYAWGFDIARKQSPLIVMTGFPRHQTRINPAAKTREEGAPSDPTLWAWLDGHQKKGVVWFSMGSEAMLKNETLSTLLAGMRQVTQPRGAHILMGIREENWERLGITSETSLGPDVTVRSWVDQELVLHHPAVRAFVSHGGPASISEAICSGPVPVLAVPFFADQTTNAMRMQEAGMGLYVNHHEMTAKEVAAKLAQLWDEPGPFIEAMKKQYRINFLGGSPAQKGADAIETVLAVGTGHLIPAEDRVGFLAATNLDIYALFAAVALGVLGTLGWLLVKVLLLMLRCMCAAPQRQATAAKKTS